MNRNTFVFTANILLQLNACLTTHSLFLNANMQLIVWQQNCSHLLCKSTWASSFSGCMWFCCSAFAGMESRLVFSSADCWQRNVPNPWPFLSLWPCHKPSIMARRSSPLLLTLGDWSPDSVNSPMILANSALACWSWKTIKRTRVLDGPLQGFEPHHSKSGWSGKASHLESITIQS